MSIWASWEAPDDDEHEDGCAALVEVGERTYEVRPALCDCGQPDAPLVYHGSHVMPENDAARGGHIDVASLSRFVRFYRDNPDAPTSGEPDGWEPFLRFGVNQSQVVLTERNVRQLHATLTEWLAGLETE